jgi:hypothetical protein
MAEQVADVTAIERPELLGPVARKELSIADLRTRIPHPFQATQPAARLGERSQLDVPIRSSGVIRICALALCFGLFVGCESEDHGRPETAAEQQARTDPQPSPDGGGANPAPPPDAGTATGHGGDATRVIVPERDASPPAARIALADSATGRTLAETSRPRSPHSGELELAEPRLRGTTVGEDPNGGITRVRVSISERISCRGDDGTRFERLRVRYFPPPQTEQIRAAPGARLPTRSTRSRLLSLAELRCGAKAEGTEVHGKLWGEVINGHGLETITPPVRFRYRR